MSIANLWRRYSSGGVSLVLVAMAFCFLAAIIGQLTGTFDLYRWLALNPRRFWSGEIWTALTYFLLPAGIPNFVLCSFFILWLGGMLAKVWQRNDFLVYCAVAILGTALAKVLVTPSSNWPLVGASGLVFALITAIGVMLGHERVVFLGIGEMSIRKAMWIIGGLNLVVALPCAGWLNTLILLGGAVAGWIYLALRSRIPGSGAARQIPNDRVSKLEL